MAAGLRTPCPLQTCLRGSVRRRIQFLPFLFLQCRIENRTRWGTRAELYVICVPGWISVTRMGVSTTSRRREVVNACTAALVAQYTLPPAYESLPAIDPMLMTWPALRALKSVVISQPYCRWTVNVCAFWGWGLTL